MEVKEPGTKLAATVVSDCKLNAGASFEGKEALRMTPPLARPFVGKGGGVPRPPSEGRRPG